MFIITVKPMAPDRAFNFDDLVPQICVRHEECGSDAVNWAPPAECGCPWKFTCRQCSAEASILSVLDGKLKITATALDGAERDLAPGIKVVVDIR